VLRIQSNEREQVAHHLVVIAVESVDLHRLADDRGDGHARVERRVRILEHDLHALAVPPQLAVAQCEYVGAFEVHAARRRLQQS